MGPVFLPHADEYLFRLPSFRTFFSFPPKLSSVHTFFPMTHLSLPSSPGHRAGREAPTPSSMRFFGGGFFACSKGFRPETKPPLASFFPKKLFPTWPRPRSTLGGVFLPGGFFAGAANKKRDFLPRGGGGFAASARIGFLVERKNGLIRLGYALTASK